MSVRIGIVADIHDAVEPLERALSLLRERGVDRIVTLGDAFETFEPGDPGPKVGALLQGAGAVGVWGNHDFGLSDGASEEVRRQADAGLVEFASRLEPRLVIEGCHFCHIEPWKDPRSLVDLWLFEEYPDTLERARRSFDAVPERILFVGHFHSSLVVREDGRVEWVGARPIRLSEPHRHLVLVPAVLRGWCATYDTDISELALIRCAAPQTGSVEAG